MTVTCQLTQTNYTYIIIIIHNINLLWLTSHSARNGSIEYDHRPNINKYFHCKVHLLSINGSVQVPFYPLLFYYARFDLICRKLYLCFCFSFLFFLDKPIISNNRMKCLQKFFDHLILHHPPNVVRTETVLCTLIIDYHKKFSFYSFVLLLLLCVLILNFGFRHLIYMLQTIFARANFFASTGVRAKREGGF